MVQTRNMVVAAAQAGNPAALQLAGPQPPPPPVAAVTSTPPTRKATPRRKTPKDRETRKPGKNNPGAPAIGAASNPTNEQPEATATRKRKRGEHEEIVEYPKKRSRKTTSNAKDDQNQSNMTFSVDDAPNNDNAQHVTRAYETRNGAVPNEGSGDHAPDEVVHTGDTTDEEPPPYMPRKGAPAPRSRRKPSAREQAARSKEKREEAKSKRSEAAKASKELKEARKSMSADELALSKQTEINKSKSDFGYGKQPATDNGPVGNTSRENSEDLWNMAASSQSRDCSAGSNSADDDLEENGKGKRARKAASKGKGKRPTKGGKASDEPDGQKPVKGTRRKRGAEDEPKEPGPSTKKSKPAKLAKAFDRPDGEKSVKVTKRKRDAQEEPEEPAPSAKSKRIKFTMKIKGKAKEVIMPEEEGV